MGRLSRTLERWLLCGVVVVALAASAQPAAAATKAFVWPSSEASADRLRVLFGLPTAPGWVATADTRSTARFRTDIATPTAVRTAPDIGAPSVGALAIRECDRCGDIGDDRTTTYRTVLPVRPRLVRDPLRRRPPLDRRLGHARPPLTETPTSRTVTT